MIIQYLRFSAFLAWVLLFNANTVWATVVKPDCPFMEGVALSESQIQQLTSGSCDSCECIRESFIQTNLTSLNERYKSQLAETLRIRFEKYRIPSFIHKMREYKVSSPSCGLNRFNEMGCQSEKMLEAVQQGYNLFLGRDNSFQEKSCFPRSTVQRSIHSQDVQEEFNAVQMFDNMGALGDLPEMPSDPVLKAFVQNRDQFESIPQSYEAIKEQVLNGPVKEKLNESFKAECDQFFEEMEELYCQRPNKLYSSDEGFAQAFGFFPDEDFPVGASYKDLEAFTLKCTLKGCQENSQRPLCSEDKSEDSYDVDKFVSEGERSLFRGVADFVEIDQAALRLDQYCPLLECEDMDEAKDKMSDNEQQCSPASPPKTLDQLISDLNCGEADENPLCQRDPLDKVIEAYKSSDEALPTPEELLGQRDPKDLDIDEKKEILRSHGLSDEELGFLGDDGINYAFGESLSIDAPELSREEVSFHELGAQDAQELEQEREEAIMAKADGEEVRESNRFAKAFNSRPHETQNKEKVESNTSVNRVSNRPATVNRTNSFSQNLAQVSDDKFRPAVRDRFQRRDEPENSNSGVKELTSRLEELRKQADRMKEDNDQQKNRERRELADRVRQLERMIDEGSTSSQNERRSDRDDFNNIAPVNPSKLFPTRDEMSPRAGQEVESSENIEPQERENEGLGQQSASNASAQVGRSPASNPEATSALNAPEGTKYYEQESEQLPLFTLDSLEGLNPGEGFILGVREGAELKEVLMTPITSDAGTFYDSTGLENLSPQARASLLESPFFQEYAHPELKIRLQESVREAKKHEELIELLGEQL